MDGSPGNGELGVPAGQTGADARRVQWFLGIGAAVGLALAAWGVLRPELEGAGLAGEVVASVNGRSIRLEDYRSAVAAFQSDRRTPSDAEDRAHVLSRLIDEELLVQRGLALGLARHDRRVRSNLVSAVIESVVAAAELEEPDATALDRFYAENREFFTRVARVDVRVLFVRIAEGRSDAQARTRAEEGLRALRAGENFDSVEARFGDPSVVRVPRGLLPPAKLREYVGPTATLSALALEPGGVSEPMLSAGGYRVILLEDRRVEEVPPLREIEAQVRAELRRRNGDRALRDYLDRLREDGEVRVRDPLP